MKKVEILPNIPCPLYLHRAFVVKVERGSDVNRTKNGAFQIFDLDSLNPEESEYKSKKEKKRRYGSGSELGATSE